MAASAGRRSVARHCHPPSSRRRSCSSLRSQVPWRSSSLGAVWICQPPPQNARAPVRRRLPWLRRPSRARVRRRLRADTNTAALAHAHAVTESRRPARRRAPRRSRHRRRHPSRTQAEALGGPDPRALPELRRCPGRSNCYIYIVEPGNNLYSIAHYYRVSYDRVLRMSPWITDPADIRTGDEVRMPTPQRPSR
jgi:hypothetical protein